MMMTKAKKTSKGVGNHGGMVWADIAIAVFRAFFRRPIQFLLKLPLMLLGGYYFTRGMRCFHDRDFIYAISALEKAVQLDKEGRNKLAYSTLHQCYLKTGQREKALLARSNWKKRIAVPCKNGRCSL
jgi:tetratricopeptide (TPR) repeat protein